MANLEHGEGEDKPRRIAVDIDDKKLLERLETAKERIGIKTNGTFGEIAIAFAVDRVLKGELIAVNGKLVTAN